MTNPDFTEIICVIDRSGSMGVIQDDAIGGFNTFLDEQKKVDKPCALTYAQFDSEYEIVHDGVPIKDVPPLDHKTYVPRGSTALYDAIGRTINVVGARLAKTPEHERPGKVLFTILTDGHENSSCEFRQGTIKEMIEHQRNKYQWEFIYLAANQDAATKGRSMGVARNHNFSATGQSVMSTYKGASEAFTSYRLCNDAGEANAALDGMTDHVDPGAVVSDSSTPSENQKH